MPRRGAPSFSSWREHQSRFGTKAASRAHGRRGPADMVLGLLSAPDDRTAAEQAPPFMTAIASHMSDRTIAKFVARNVVQESTATDRLALAFQTLVRDGEERQRLLTVARDDVASSPFGSTEGFDAAWD